MMHFQNFSGKIIQPAVLLLILSWLGSCASQNSVSTAETPPANASEIPDFGNLYYWAAHPYKTDPSDSTPTPYRQFEKDSAVDVFFIYPTSYTNNKLVDSNLLSEASERAKWNASVNDEALNEFTDNSSILNQASAFNKYRVFAPRYRQAHIMAFFVSPEKARAFFDTAYADVLNAFDYYMAHYNQGRPFIIASHSQGTLHAARLIAERIDNTALQDQMIAAYLPGMPVPANNFKDCPVCHTADETGCFVSWRSFKTGYVPEYVLKEDFKLKVVNPLTWQTDSSMAGKELNHGAVLFKFNDPQANAVSAQVHGNILWVSKPKFFGSMFYTKKNYHIGDINLFWKNIRENVDERIAAYRQQHISSR